LSSSFSSSSSCAFPFPFESFFELVSFLSAAGFEAVGRGAKNDETGGLTSFLSLSIFDSTLGFEVLAAAAEVEGLGAGEDFVSFFFLAGDGLASSDRIRTTSQSLLAGREEMRRKAHLRRR
jgi:hypothetical protein